MSSILSNSLLIGGTIISGILYCYKNPNTIWKGIKIYGSIQHTIQKNIKPIYNNISQYIVQSDENILVIHDGKTIGQYVSINDIPRDMEFDFITEKILYQDEIYQRIHETFVPNVTFIPVKRYFIEIELIQNGETFSLDLSHFYVAQNRILTKSFLKWQLKMKYNMELDDSYEIHIIDMNIKSLTIKGHQYIELFQDNYKIQSIIDSPMNEPEKSANKTSQTENIYSDEVLIDDADDVEYSNALEKSFNVIIADNDKNLEQNDYDFAEPVSNGPVSKIT